MPINAELRTVCKSEIKSLSYIQNIKCSIAVSSSKSQTHFLTPITTIKILNPEHVRIRCLLYTIKISQALNFVHYVEFIIKKPLSPLKLKVLCHFSLLTTAIQWLYLGMSVFCGDKFHFPRTRNSFSASRFSKFRDFPR